ncbi:MAG TPA: GTP 3',8-cyclase MoaA [Nitrospiria bacterium]
MSRLIDLFGRSMSYLRLSVTDRCDMRCVYCLPVEGAPHSDRQEVLTFEEYRRLAQVLTRLGVNQIRVTGGEPLLRKDLPVLVRYLSDIDGLLDLSLTTNASRLAPMAAGLKAAGLNRINISLDSLRPESFSRITRGSHLAATLDGIDRAIEAGFSPVKVNTVVMRGVNDGELCDLVRFSIERGVTIRFLEIMPLGAVGAENRDRFMPFLESKQIIEREFALEPLPFEPGSTTLEFRLKGTSSKIGFINPVSERFCSSCNRLRLSARGRLQFCLAHEEGVDLKAPLRAGWSDSALEELVLESALRKPAGNRFAEDPEPVYTITMSGLGG